MLDPWFLSWCRALVGADRPASLAAEVPRHEPGRMPRRAFPNVAGLAALPPLAEPSCENLGAVGLPLCPYLSEQGATCQFECHRETSHQKNVAGKENNKESLHT